LPEIFETVNWLKLPCVYKWRKKMVSRRTILMSGVALLGAAALPNVALAATTDIYVTSENIAING